MPSSSNRDTAQETALHTCWRTAAIRLRSVGATNHVASLSKEFARALDVSYEDLMKGYWPPGPAGKESEVAKHERRMRLETEAQGLRWSDAGRIESAGTACVEAGEVLEMCGRKREGEVFGEMGKELHALAVKVARREERWRASKGDYDSSEGWSESDEDAEMKDG